MNKKKSLALIAAIVLLFTMVMTTSFIVAVAANYTVETNIDQAYLTGMGSNILKGKTLLEGSDWSEAKSSNYNGTYYLTDGVLVHKKDLGNLYYGNLGVLFYNSINKMFVYDLGANYTATKALVAGIYDAAENYCINEYKLFLSTDKKTLFTDESLIVHYTNNQWVAGDEVNSPGAAQAFLFNQDTQPSGRYFGIQLVVPNSRTIVDKTAYLNQFGLYGMPADYTVNNEVQQSDVTALGGNILKNNSKLYNAADPAAWVEITSSSNYNGVPFLNDGVLRHSQSGGTLYRGEEGLIFWAGSGKKYAYDMEISYSAEDILVAGGYDMTGGGADYSISEYKVFLSNNKVDLFSDANCVIYYINSEKAPAQWFEYNDLAQKPTGRYFGVEIIKSNETSTNVYLNQFGVYGYPAGYTVVDGLKQNTTIDEFGQKLGSNILSKKTLEVYSDGTYSAPTYGSDGYSSVSRYTDNTVYSAHTTFYEGNGKMLAYDMQDTYQISKLMVAGIYDTAVNKCIAKYKIFISDSKDALFNDENCVVSHTNNAWAAGSDSFLGGAQAFLINHDSYITGRYVGFQFEDASWTETVVRISELGVYGSPANGRFTVSQGVTQLEYNKQGTNLLTGKDMYKNNIDTNAFSLVTKDSTGRATSELANDNITQQLRWYDNAKNYGTMLYYNLGDAYEIEKLVVAGIYDSVNNYSLAHYEIYISNSLDTLWNSSSMVIDYYNTAYKPGSTGDLMGAVQLFEFTNGNLPKGQYYGIHIPDSMAPLYPTSPANYFKELRISELAVFANKANAGYTVTQNMTQEEYEALGNNILSGKKPYDTNWSLIEYDSSGYRKTEWLTDGTLVGVPLDLAVDFWNGDGKKLAYDIGHGDYIDRLLVGSWYSPTDNQTPANYKIYVSNTQETLWNTENCVTNYYNNAWKANSSVNAGSTQLFTYGVAGAELPYGRYIGFEFVDCNVTSATLRLWEIGAYTMTEIPVADNGITAIQRVAKDGEAYDVPAGSGSLKVGNISTGNHTLTVTDQNGDNHVYFVADGTVTYQSQFTNSTTFLGSAIRVQNPQGLRFKTSMTKLARDSGKIIEYGTVVAKKSALNGKELVVDSPDYTSIKAVAFNATDGTEIIYGENETTVEYTVALYNIAQRNYRTYYSARPYMICEDASGNLFTVYGETQTKRILSVAEQASTELEKYSPIVQEYIMSIVNNSEIATISQAYATSLNVTPEMLQQSVVSEGNKARIAKVLRKAALGEDITLGVLGGSITAGASASPGRAYANRVRDWLQNEFPDTNVKLVNAGIGSTTSMVGVHRIEADLLKYDPDLVIVEYSVNESDSQLTFENVIRRVMLEEQEIGLIMLFTMRDNGWNNQDAEIPIGTHYGVPMISYRDAIWPAIEDPNNTDFEWGTVGADTVHPNNKGHEIIGALIGDYLARLYSEIDTIGTTVPVLPDVMFTDIYMDAILYTSATLPKDMIVSLGSMAVNTNAFHQFKNGWTATYDGNAAQPMVLNLGPCQSVTLLIRRTAKAGAGKALAQLETHSRLITKTCSNAYPGLNADYADAIQLFTTDTAEDMVLTITPELTEGQYFTLLGIMIA
ncbi:MAG: GDSL-type esterase/lipase family protein [Oscillospiraceae bacterium]|nr:GDSL-type esterase/lipase family protein [Oscillospiraceae bacterium]MDD4545708.1 GDSL-type esterase/lipase family protein [Oscillospiraceae bacterium]